MIKDLPIDPRLDMPVPFFVARPRDWKPGDPIDFRLVDPARLKAAYRKGLCHVCGGRLTPRMTYAFGPMCLATSTSAEGPMHYQCAWYSIRHCPFLSNPRMKRSPRAMPAGVTDPDGVMLDRNPGVTVLGLTMRKPRLIDGSMLYRLPAVWDRLEFWREGRAATQGEVLRSIETGAPALVEAANADGPEAVAACAAQLARTVALVAIKVQA